MSGLAVWLVWPEFEPLYRGAGLWVSGSTGATLVFLRIHVACLSSCKPIASLKGLPMCGFSALKALPGHIRFAVAACIGFCKGDGILGLQARA